MATAVEELSIDAVAELQHEFIGPTWQRGEDGKWKLPKRTLGWQIIQWVTDYLVDPELKPWKFTLEQVRFILWWYAVDERGRFVYRTGVLQRMKGWGKDPLLAIICLIELLGPSRFSHWQDDKPVGEAHPAAWVQIAAVSQEQTRNTMSLVHSLMSDKLRNEYGVKAGAELIRAKNGRVWLEAVTSSYRALEGRRTTFTVLNETHHWISGNGGIKMYETIDGNVTKMDSRYLAITNAYLPGEDSVAERMRQAWQKIQDGRAKDIGFLYDSVEAHPQTPLTQEALEIVVPIIRGDAYWLNVEAIIQSISNLAIDPARSRRMWLNQVVADSDALIGPELWVPLEDPDLVLEAGDRIVLGFDGGKSDDATALVAIRVEDQAVFVLLLEEKPDGPAGDNWQVNKARVDSAIHEAHRLYNVAAFYADVALWESYIDDWAETYGEGYDLKANDGHAIAWDMRRSEKTVTLSNERLMAAIIDGKIKHDGDPDLRRHVFNTRRRSNNYGVSFGKESRESPNKVDLYAAMMLAYTALHDLRTRVSAVKKKQRTGEVHFF